MAFVAPDGSEFDSRDGLREYLLESGFLEFSDKQGLMLVKSVGDIDGEGFALSKLSGCEIVLLDHIEQITIENLANCKVFVGPCKGSCYVRECKDCLFTVMCNQLRIIKCEECIFFTHVKTDPVIERSKRLHFGAYNGPKTSEISALAMLSGFDLDQQSKWRSVFDLTEEKSSPRQRDWVLVEEHQALFDVRTAAVSPLGHCILRDLFWRLDDDRDGGLSYLELNAFQRMIGSNETVKSAEELREKFQEVGLPLDVNGNLPFDSFLELYQLQGEDGLLSDLDKLGLDPTSAPRFDIYAVIQRSKLMLPISPSCPPPTYHHATRQPFDQASSSSEEYDEEDFEAEQGDSTARTGTGAETEKLTALAASNQVQNLRKSSEKVIERSLLPEKPPKKHETVSEMQLHDGTREELYVEPTSRADMVVQDARSLCAEAKRRGVNLRMWFESYGHGEVSFLPCKTFETAFSALLLGLCAGSGEDFIRTVEYVLAPEQLSVLSNALRDTNVRDGIDFAGLLPQPRGGSNSPMRKQNRAKLSTPLVSNISTAKPVSQVVNEPVEQFLINLFKNMQQKEESNELFEKLRDAIQSWKWSEGGRMPTRGGGTWSTQREFISIGNLRSALRASLQADFSIELVSSFVDMIEQVVESDTEAKARHREQRDLSKHGHPLWGSPDNDKVPLSPASQSPHEAETDSICSNEPRDINELRHKLATVPALIRWITSIRVAKSIPRDAWLHGKANAEKREDERRKARLEAALRDDDDMLRWLMERENRKELEDTLAASPEFIPKESIPGEAQVRAKNILAGPSGESLLRKRVFQLSNREKAPVSTMKLESVAKTQLIDELAVEQEHALRHDLGARVDLFLVYARGRMSGLVTTSFTSWLQHREADRAKRRKTLQEWQKKKEESVRVHRSEEQWVCVASTVFGSLRKMVNQTCVQLREEKSGVLINRSSRYKGLDAETVISQLTKAKVEEYSRKPNSKPLDVAHAEVAAIAAGEFVITHNQVRKSFDGILTSLLADARTRDEALALLDPIAAAKEKQKAKSGKKVSGNSEEDGNQLLGEVFKSAGFTKVGSKEDMDRLLHTAQGERRKKADMEFKKWKKEKAKKERTRRKLEAAQAKLSKEEELKRTTKSKKAYSRWKKAAAQNKYISFKTSESGSGTSKKLRSVARPRMSKPSREEVEKLLERPTWVESLEDSHSVTSVERENVDA